MKNSFDELDGGKLTVGTQEKSYISMGILDYIAINIVSFLIILFTLGLGTPLAVVIKEKYICDRRYVNGRKLKFIGTAGDLFVNFIKWFILCIITLGIYIF